MDNPVNSILLIITAFTVAAGIFVLYDYWSTRKKKSKTKHT